MSIDITTRFRTAASKCTHGNEQFYNGPEGIEVYFRNTCGLCNSWTEAANEIDKLRKIADGLANALHIQVSLSPKLVTGQPWYSQHAKDALAVYDEAVAQNIKEKQQ
jgi:hypothetical protein